ncbi:hypothetical protein RRG08_046165 [Elysia crispata]|uniref:Uncharacterized protein n=1 Tax=Elysia crispata TaxID=231223 RepID=A0AAE1CJG3_9GAST|nr:hypothetical protein RRG08_046165 [Elysia crispata]
MGTSAEPRIGDSEDKAWPSAPPVQVECRSCMGTTELCRARLRTPETKCTLLNSGGVDLRDLRVFPGHRGQTPGLVTRGLGDRERRGANGLGESTAVKFNQFPQTRAVQGYKHQTPCRIVSSFS